MTALARCKCGAVLQPYNRSGLCSACYHERARERREGSLAQKKGRKCEWCLERGHSQDTCEMKRAGMRPTFIDYVPPEPVPRYSELFQLYVRRVPQRQEG